MAKSYPAELANVYDGTANKMGRGDVRETIRLSSRNTFNTATQPATTGDTLSLGKLKKGDVPRAFEISASVNMSAASIAIGTAAVPTKYLAAATLPNATHARRVVLPAAAGFTDGATVEGEELIVTISGATIPAGLLVIDTEFVRR